MNTMKFISWKDVSIHSGFWKYWQDTVAQNTSRAIYNQFSQTGRIEAMKLEWKEGQPNKPHVFWDSDIAKWMEGTAYLLAYHDDGELREILETIIGYIEKGQDSNGYFNSAFLTLHPEAKFTDRTDHELYTAGHLIEAAVAHYHSTGSRRFLNCMKKFADYIEKVFVIDKSAKFLTPGHQELELALYRLWLATGERRYLKLSQHFVETRGRNAEERVFSVPNGTWPAKPELHNQLYYNDTYAQDDAPARELKAAAGHAVRAMYFYTAMADLSNEFDDDSLYEACKRLWSDSALRKMYITGGISAEKHGEAIGTDYVLPNEYSYAETCASVAMANFSQRMFLIEPDSRYTDMIERQMFNGALAGLSIDGTGFFYDNALLSRASVNEFFDGIHARFLLPANQRQKVFECSCCPPNIYRFLAVLGQYFYSTDESTLFIHQYASMSAHLNIGGTDIDITQTTNYPWDEDIAITLHPASIWNGRIAIRLPEWCRNAIIQRNGTDPQYKVEKGYAYLSGEWQDGDTITLKLPMPVVQMKANPNLAEACGKAVLMRGPVVYCLESVDNAFPIFDLTLPQITGEYQLKPIDIAGLTVTAIKGSGYVRNSNDWKDALYQEYSPEYQKAEFTAVPYFSWANRGKSDMVVWISKQDSYKF